MARRDGGYAWKALPQLARDSEVATCSFMSKGRGTIAGGQIVSPYNRRDASIIEGGGTGTVSVPTSSKARSAIISTLLFEALATLKFEARTPLDPLAKHVAQGPLRPCDGIATTLSAWKK